MHIAITVKPNAKKTIVTPLSPTEFKVDLHASPQHGQANLELIRTLAKHLCLPQSRFIILRGLTSRKKTIKILPA